MKKIVVVENLDLNDAQKERLNALGDVHYFEAKESDAAAWLERVAGADVICAGVQGFIDAYPQLHDVFVTVPYIGLDFIDLSVAKQNNISISNSPGCNKQAVAELAIGLLLYVARRLDVVVNAPLDMSESQLATMDAPGVGLAGKKAVILGRGNIGTALAAICKAFGMTVVVHTRADEIVQSASGADVLFNALDANPTTAGLVNESVIAACNKGAIYVSVARNETEDIAALLAALDSGQLSGVGHDSGSTRSGVRDAPQYRELLAHSKVYVTPHIGFNTDQSVENCGSSMIDNIEAWLRGEQQNVIV